MQSGHGEAVEPAQEAMMKQLNDESRRQVGDLVESMPWGDMLEAIACLEQALRLALEATQDNLLLWEDEAADRGHEEEFDITPDQVAQMTDEWRFAYIGRLIQTIATGYGMDNAFGRASDTDWTLRNLLRGLQNITCR